jgi:hypothetical protein
VNNYAQNQDLSRVTLTRGSNAVDLTEDYITEDPHYDTWGYLQTAEGGYVSSSTHSSMPGLIDIETDQQDYDEDISKYNNRNDYGEEDDEETYFNDHEQDDD